MVSSQVGRAFLRPFMPWLTIPCMFVFAAAMGANGVTTGGFANDPSVCRNSGSLRCEGE